MPDTIFPEVALDQQQVIDGKRYAVTEKFGYNTVSFNKANVDPSTMQDMTKLWRGSTA